jgi:hypothetical protein
MEKRCDFFEVGTGFLSIIYISSVPQRVKRMLGSVRHPVSIPVPDTCKYEYTAHCPAADSRHLTCVLQPAETGLPFSRSFLSTSSFLHTHSDLFTLFHLLKREKCRTLYRWNFHCVAFTFPTRRQLFLKRQLQHSFKAKPQGHF